MPSISEITEPHHYHDVPDDWYIAMTDVRGSTVAIANGKYKEVCAVAAASVAAQLNIMQEKDAPFVFGGDGASILIPPEALEASRAALAGTRKMAREQFSLELRAALVPVRDVIAAGHRIRIARLEVSSNFQQAIFNGGGMRHAENLMKDPQSGAQYLVPDSVLPNADFHGVECRWNQIPSAREENVALMVMATGNSPDEENTVYQDVLAQIEAIYGDTVARHPIAVPNLKMTFKRRNLSVEGRIRHQENFNFRTLRRMMWGSLKARIAMWLNIGQWGTYKTMFYESTDHEKFDDTLRMIISGSKTQRQALTVYLDGQYQQGRLVYGLHTSRAALVTCIVYDYFGHQMHLVDGASGGYTLAAKAMKEQLTAQEKPKI